MPTLSPTHLAAIARRRRLIVNFDVTFAINVQHRRNPDRPDLRLSSGLRRAQSSRRSLNAFPDFLLAEALSLPDAAYRFCRDEPGVHVVLSGTGNAAHLDANLASFARPPLTQQTRNRLIHIFRRVNSTTGQAV